MQPYFLPYIGYFQLMNAVDEFIVYDNIEFTKKGWINRNRMLVNGTDAYFTIPLKKGSDYLQIKDRSLSQSWPSERIKLLNRIKEVYRKAPFFEQTYSLFEKCVLVDEDNLFSFIYFSLERTKEHLDISAKLIVSSTLAIDHDLKAENKVMAICKERKATVYINPQGGVNLYNKSNFSSQGIELSFLKPASFTYNQFGNTFAPWLSILDVMMFNEKEEVKKVLSAGYSLI